MTLFQPRQRLMYFVCVPRLMLLLYDRLLVCVRTDRFLQYNVPLSQAFCTCSNLRVQEKLAVLVSKFLRVFAAKFARIQTTRIFILRQLHSAQVSHFYVCVLQMDDCPLTWFPASESAAPFALGTNHAQRLPVVLKKK